MLIDGHGRKVDYLRISITERCNFRCQYCMPEKPFSWVPKENLLNFEDMFKFVKVAIDEGITKVRITGGEPLLREDLDSFISMIHNYKNDIDLALTTNGYFLKQVGEKSFLRFPFNEDMTCFWGEEYELYELLDFFHNCLHPLYFSPIGRNKKDL